MSRQYPPVTPEDVDALKHAIGESHVSTGSSNLDLHSKDESYHEPHRPDVVVWPQTTEDVVACVKLAAEKGYAVTPWCAGTSLEGNPIPIKGGLVLDFTEMNRILEIREKDLQVDVEVGIQYRELNNQLRHYGLFFPPDPGAWAAIGGMIGNNASGVRTVAYGATRDCVLGLEVVTADGDVLHLGSRAIKSSSGYDLVRLMIGSEGTLGIVTRATLRLRGLPPEYLTVVATFPAIHDACEAVSDTIRYGLNPAALELMDAAVVAEINRDQKMTLAERPMLFLEFHNVNESALESQFEMVQGVLQEHGALTVERGIGADERVRLWEVRHGALESIKRNHPGASVLLVDTCVPISRYAEMVDRAKETVEREGAVGFFWGHAGDGNLHLGLLYDPADAAAKDAVARVNRTVVEHGIAAGGSCTGEHGVGIGKLPFVEAEHGKALDYMRRIKAALDPKGILNPGKMLPE
ncbi:MAG: FAD-binding oxidoreductase [Deltaproteobacteria bacterium]|nr:FAD-binding oxidoreductase [Deltaproteobacteria bacterium]